MLTIPEHSILIVPSALHLAFYKEIFSQKQNCLDIELFSLETFIDSFLLQKEPETIELLYQCKQALQSLSEDNAFYSSRNDIDFLNTILSFLRMVKLFKIENLPTSTKKEKDVYEILEKTKHIPLKESQEIQAESIPFDRVYILKKEYNEIQSYWVHFLIKNKAHWLESDVEQVKHYWSCANVRKEIEVVANEILNQEYKAEDVFIAIDNDNERYVLSQIFDAHQIPYTFLKSDAISNIPQQWSSCLKYVRHASMDTYLDVVKAMYPKSGQCVCQYHELFKGVRLSDMEYEENALIDEETFISYQQLEQDCLQWECAHSFIKDWNQNNLQAIGTAIQNIYPNPSEEDLSTFESIVQTIAYAQPYLKDEEDLTFLIQYIEHMQASRSLESIQGVLIGRRQDISALRPITFYLGVHSKVFPGLHLYNGIFNEAYLAKTTFTPLQQRLQEQRNQIFAGLSQPQTLYVLFPQSDYQGKSFEASYEMNEWMHKKPVFQALRDPSFIIPPKFDVSSENSQQLFFQDQMYQSSYSRIHAFNDCPLKHYLRYGLSLKADYQKDPLKVRKEFLERVLLNARVMKQKQYKELTMEDVQHLVESEFHFARMIFTQKEVWFQEQIHEYTFRIHALLDQLNVLETQLHLQLLNKEYQIQENRNFKDVQVEMKGSLQAYDAYAANFLLFNDIMDPTHPLGSFQLSLKPRTEEHKALNVSYRSSQPEYSENAEKALNDSVLEKSVIDGWKLQDLPDTISDPLLKKIQKKAPSYQDCQQKLEDSLDFVLEKIEEGTIAPSHAKDACVYCPYKAICRNSAKGSDHE